jgi:hypothetical protein
MKHILLISALFLSLTANCQVVLVGTSGGGASPNVTAGDSLTTSDATVSLKGIITGSPTNYYWSHNGLGTIADSTKLNTTYTVHANDTVIWFDLVGFYNFSGVLDTAYDRRVVTISGVELPVVVISNSYDTITVFDTYTFNSDSITLTNVDTYYYTNDGGGYVDDSTNNVSMAYTSVAIDEDSTITFILTGESGVHSDSDTMYLVVNPEPEVYLDYSIATNPDTLGLYIDFENPLINDTAWAISFSVVDYAERDSPGEFAGSGSRFLMYLAFSESGNVGGELANGVKVISTISEGYVKTNEWVNVFIYSPGDSVHFDVGDGAQISRALPSDSNTTFVMDYFISGAAGTTDNADGRFNNLKTWNLTGYEGAWTRSAISAIEPDHYFKFDEGTGNTVYDEITADTGAVINSWYNQWQNAGLTTWEARVICTTGTPTDARPDQNMWYDLYSNTTYVSWMGDGGDKYVTALDHDTDIISDSVLVADVAAYDGHSYPNICVTDSGYILVTGTDYAGDIMTIARSTNPRDISSWELDTFAAPYFSGTCRFAEYPRPFKARNGDIYIFHTQRPGPADDQVIRWHYYIKSTDEGRTWSDRVLCLSRSGDANGLNEIYVGQMTEEKYRFGEPQRIWATWIAAGGVTHDDYHSDLYAAYFIPDSNKWYGPDGTSLGADIDIAEMEGNTAGIQIVDSPDDPLGMYTGYVNTIFPNNSDTVLVNGTYSYDGSIWDSIAYTGIATEHNRTRWADGDWYAFTNTGVYTAPDNNNRAYTLLNQYTLTGTHGYSQNKYQTVSNNPEHRKAIAHIVENHSTNTNNINWLLGAYTTDSTAAALFIEAPDRTPPNSSETTIRVYVTDKTFGARSRVVNATNMVNLTVLSGNCTIDDSSVNAVGGCATFTINTSSIDEECILRATSSGLDPYYIHIYIE